MGKITASAENLLKVFTLYLTVNTFRMTSVCAPAGSLDDRDSGAGLITGVVVKPQTRFTGPKAGPSRETGHRDNRRLAELFKDKVRKDGAASGGARRRE